MDKLNFNEISPWCDIKQEIIDGNHMVKIPAFYYRQGVFPTGHQRAGEKYWIVSKLPFQDAILHPAFNGKPYFYVGSYESSFIPGAKYGNEENVSRSVPNVLPAQIYKVANGSYQTKYDYAVQTYYSSVVGSAYNYTELSAKQYEAIQILWLIEAGTSDVKSTHGKGNCDTGYLKPTGTSGGSWRGIYDLFGNGLEYVSLVPGDAFNITEGYISKVKNPLSRKEQSNFLPLATEVASKVNPYHSYYLGKKVDFSDYPLTPRDLVRGGSYDLGAKCGLFTIGYYTTEQLTTQPLSLRIACTPK